MLSLRVRGLDQFVQPAQLVRLARKRAAGVAGGGARLVLVAQHHIGAHQPQPSLDVGAVLLQPLGQPRRPCRAPSSSRCSGDKLGSRPRCPPRSGRAAAPPHRDRRAPAIPARSRPSRRRPARRPAACARPRPLPSDGRPARRQAPENSAPGNRRRSRRSARSNASLGLGGDDAVGGAGQRLAEIGLALGGRAEQPQHVAPRLHRVVVAAEPHIDRAEHLPAAAVLADFARDAPRPGRPVRRSSAAPAADRAAPPAAAPASRASRAPDRDRRRRAAAAPGRQSATARRRQSRAAGRRDRRRGVRRRDQPPRHLDARGLRLALADQAAGAVALDLVELVAIDRDIAAGAQRLRAAPAATAPQKSRPPSSAP